MFPTVSVFENYNTNIGYVDQQDNTCSSFPITVPLGVGEIPSNSVYAGESVSPQQIQVQRCPRVSCSLHRNLRNFFYYISGRDSDSKYDGKISRIRHDLLSNLESEENCGFITNGGIDSGNTPSPHSQNFRGKG